MKKLAIALLVLLVLIGVKTSAYYNPGPPTGYVNDFAQVFSEEQKEGLEAKLSQYEINSSNELSIVTIKSLEGDTIENFTEKLFKEWGIGKEDKDNGVLMLFAMDDREVRIEVGYGLEPILTDIYSSRIIRETIVPNFQSGNFFEGISKSVDQIIQISGGTLPEELASDPKPNIFDQIGPFFLFILFFGFNFIMVIGSILAKSKSWWAGGVIGFVIAIILFLISTFWIGFIAAMILTPLGLLFDFLVSKSYKKSLITGNTPWWMGRGGGRVFGGGGGFGGFGGGSSGGGGASGRW